MSHHAPIRAAIIGHPVSHSKSPLIHNHWIKKHGLSGEYGRVDIAPENLNAGVQKLIDEAYAGFNVTIPHKQEIFKLCDHVDETAQKIGAVNTVVIRDGKLYGTNTDAFGFIENIRQSAFGLNVSHSPCVVLGAGGAARAVVYALVEAGALEIIVTNRTREKAEELKSLGEAVRVAPWGERAKILKDAGLLINTTALGMNGKDALELDLSALPEDAIVSDIVYTPLETELLKAAKARGNQIVTGIGMLLHQARPAFEKWYGILPDVDAELEAKVLA